MFRGAASFLGSLSRCSFRGVASCLGSFSFALSGLSSGCAAIMPDSVNPVVDHAQGARRACPFRFGPCAEWLTPWDPRDLAAYRLDFSLDFQHRLHWRSQTAE